MKFICPLLVVTDINRSRDFYENILGQKVKYDYGESITFLGDFAIHLKSHYKGLIGNRRVISGGNNFELYFEQDDIEVIVSRLKEYNVTFIHEIKEQPWRQRVVRFYDPDKYIVEVGESLSFLAKRLKNEGMADEQIAKTIDMPIGFVIESTTSTR